MGKRVQKVGGALRWAYKPFIDVPSWLGASTLMQTFRGLANLTGIIFRIRHAEHQESYEEALKRLKLTEKDIAARKRNFFNLAMFYLGCSLLVLIYAVYNFWHGIVSGGFLGLVITCLALTQFFRFHFWLFQLKHKKLGCTIREWFNSEIDKEE